jgi:hypothetical protein
MSRKTMAQILEKQRVLIFNSSKPQIAPLIADLGADAAHLKKGEALYNNVLSLSKIQKKEQQEGSLAYDNYYEQRTSCKSVAKRNFRLIKLGSRADRALQNRLKLFTPKARGIEEWIMQITDIYGGVLNEPTFLAALAKYKITAASLKKDIKQLDSLKTFRDEALSETGQAQEATRLRNVKMEELEDYCYELETIAITQLEDQSQLLEMLGILVRS